MDTRVGEETVVDVQRGGSMMPGGSRSGGERSDPERREPPTPAVGVVASLKGIERPDPEVPAKAQRRRFSAQYKKKILEEADGCKGRHGAMGALLRREGLFSSHLTSWRKQREKAELDGLAPKKRGRKAKPMNPLTHKVRGLESEIRRLQEKLDKAETIISFQKKLSEMLGISLDQKENDETC
jgi:transposase-like protein